MIEFHRTMSCARRLSMRLSIAFCAVLLPSMLGGCFTARVGTGTTTAYRHDTTVTVASYLWGAVEPTEIIKNDSLNTFSDIELTQDFGQVVVSLVTLGLYVPVTAHCYFESCDTEIRR